MSRFDRAFQIEGIRSWKVDALKAGAPTFAPMRSLAMRFNGILCGCEADLLPAWIDDAIETDLTPIARFARTLSRDIDAVSNAIEMQWSNGQAEGQINRLKTLKRALYGRACPELLRERTLPFRHRLRMTRFKSNATDAKKCLINTDTFEVWKSAAKVA